MKAILIIIVPTQLKQTGITTSLLKERHQNDDLSKATAENVGFLTQPCFLCVLRTC